MNLTAVSLFAGVGGFDLALERNGVGVVAAVEIDKQARGVLARRFPNTQLFEDVQEVSGDHLRAAGFVPERGILCGGFPCQDLSVAGRRAGLAGRRSGLYWEIVRLVDELRPSWILLENVPGLLSSNGGRDFGAVLGSLVERGYGVGYRILDAQHFGVPQRRRRIFIVGCLGDDGRAPFEVLALAEGVRRNPSESGAEGEEAPGILPGSLGVSHGGDDLDRMTFVPIGLADTPDTARALTTKHRNDGDGQNFVVNLVTNDVVAPVLANTHPGGITGQDAYSGQLIPFVKARRAATSEDAESGRQDEITPTLNQFDMGDTRATTLLVPTCVTGEVTHALTAEGSDASEDGTGRGNPIVAFSHTHGQDPGASTVSAPTLTYHGGAILTEKPAAVVESEPEGGPIAFHTTQDLISGRISPALSQGNQRGYATTGVVREVGAPSLPVRRLTPVECERLQGFPDGWTSERLDPAKGVVAQADAPRYKQMGNAVAVPVVEWVVRRLVEFEDANAPKLGVPIGDYLQSTTLGMGA